MAKLVSNAGFQDAILAIPEELNLDFLVETAFEGEQIIITWNPPGLQQFDKIRLVRKRGSYPLHIVDGLILYEGNVGEIQHYSDQEVDHIEIYYYTMFLHDQTKDRWHFDRKTIGKALAIKTGIMEKKLWQLLPDCYRRGDREAR